MLVQIKHMANLPAKRRMLKFVKNFIAGELNNNDILVYHGYVIDYPSITFSYEINHRVFYSRVTYLNLEKASFEAVPCATRESGK